MQHKGTENSKVGIHVGTDVQQSEQSHSATEWQYRPRSIHLHKNAGSARTNRKLLGVHAQHNPENKSEHLELRPPAK